MRPLLEAVYAEPPAGVPHALLRGHLTAVGTDLEERHQGLLARLPFRNGLLEDWFNTSESVDFGEGEPRTRLIDSHTVVLAIVEEGVPRLLGRDADGKETVEASECRSPIRLGPLPTEASWVRSLRATLGEAEGRRLKDEQLVFLTQQEGGIWRSDPRPDLKGQRVRYCCERGFGRFSEM